MTAEIRLSVSIFKTRFIYEASKVNVIQHNITSSFFVAILAAAEYSGKIQPILATPHVFDFSVPRLLVGPRAAQYTLHTYRSIGTGTTWNPLLFP